MRKTIIKLLSPILIVLLLASCGSQNISNARVAYADGDYQGVISTLEGVEPTEEADKEMLTAAKVHVAYEEQNYEEVIALLGEDPCENDVLEPIRLISKAQIAYASKDYEAVAETLQNVDNRNTIEIYTASLENILMDALQFKDIEKISGVLSNAPELGEIVVSTVSETCGKLDYKAFLFLDQLIEQMPDGECRDALSAYAEGSTITRLQAFLNGSWAWYEEGDSEPAIVELTIQPNGSGIGILKNVSPTLAKYGFEEGEIYWRDFVYLTENTFTCYHLLKNIYGEVTGGYAYTTVDLGQEIFHMHITVASGGNLQNQDRGWVRYPAPLLEADV